MARNDNYTTFSFVANTIDGKIQEFPKQFFLRCNLVRPIGNSIVRQYNGTECIVSMKVFLIYYEGQLFGSTGYQTFDEFNAFLRSQCNDQCGVTINGCYALINGCHVTIN